MKTRPRDLPRHPHRDRRLRRHGRPRRQRRDRRPLRHEPGLGRASSASSASSSTPRCAAGWRRCRGRPVFDLVRERLGPALRPGQPGRLVLHQLPDAHRRDRRRRHRRLARRRASTTCCCIPFAAVLVWLVIWRHAVRVMERVFGLARPVPCSCSSSTVWKIGPDWGQLWSRRHPPARPDRRDAVHLRLLRHRPVRRGDDAVRGVLLLERRGRGALDRARTSTRTGPTSSSGSRSAGCCRWRSWPCAHLVLAPADISVDQLSQVAAAGRRRASASSAWPSPSSASSRRRSAPRSRRRCRPATRVAQYFGWQWGKHRAAAARRPASTSSCSWPIVVAVLIAHQRRRPGQGHRVLDRAVGRRPAADLLPDPRHRQRPRLHGRRHTNGRLLNAVATVYLVILVVVAVATIPLMIITKAGA